MFNVFKKKPEEETQLTDQISVDNLKAYVVQGYDKEKELQSKLDRKEQEINDLKVKIEELDALKVVLENKERIIRELNYKYEKVGALEKQIIDTDNKWNDQVIKNRELRNQISKMEQERRTIEPIIRSSERGVVISRITERIENHKGNLSKAKAIEIIKAK
ncbi:hypothetical protein A5819_003466 [Enterococcus sp. 7E2_DIV0204]|uniref:hypothetical protein n=1 Tax=unclassified Enterococcus TaxID=2608891 RepID=UPI000A344288|nr:MULTISPECIES: hypothetical protein [unclassified Enterococcus]OTN83705.1 hypothetical protein A5819_003802 [Enterococcus sp. 7E2_DIV0204]OTN86288.1 hypothetical protein A5819_003122 [Enterococcus sp. 7E2_DIV0204]OTN86616.1 hypothetical protein A5819_003466 [Enterococcus sp. 7E2_DIV0204]OTP47595.1 hypothetical protein A5884_003350 [Enterococcus sp. 7D2_DIV0200]OTP48519.1 hypothetical protein A5884_003182 [Enterococcus sp. 7D2_DIV0200]